MSTTHPQVIPRPEHWEPAAPPPWRSIDPDRRRGLALDDVVLALQARHGSVVPEPGSGHDGAAPVADGTAALGAVRQSAVLVALFEEEGETRVILTRRANHLRTHRGQVSFPGGGVDPGERAVDAALREADEEVGLDPALVTVVSSLAPIATFAAGAWIQPVVGTLDQRPTLIAAPSEVERVFDVALADLLVDGAAHREIWWRSMGPGMPETGFELWFFEVGGEMVWGATGHLLVDLVTAAIELEMPSLGVRGGRGEPTHTE
jgi:8-oxo-dGTP pyrophosphatase MutT (NUDIX family)